MALLKSRLKIKNLIRRQFSSNKVFTTTIKDGKKKVNHS
jgi:hypothetical protein